MLERVLVEGQMALPTVLGAAQNGSTMQMAPVRLDLVLQARSEVALPTRRAASAPQRLPTRDFRYMTWIDLDQNGQTDNGIACAHIPASFPSIRRYRSRAQSTLRAQQKA